MLTRTLLSLTTVLLTSVATPTAAFTVAEAQSCADRLLQSYNDKVYPQQLLAVENIVTTVFGSVRNSLNLEQKEYTLNVGQEHIRESFTSPTKTYFYSDLAVETVTKTDKDGEYKVEGAVTVKTPEETERYTFMALVLTPGCKVRQVRIDDWVTMINRLRETISKDPRVAHLFLR